jgi:hypothetical protein
MKRISYFLFIFYSMFAFLFCRENYVSGIAIFFHFCSYKAYLLVDLLYQRHTVNLDDIYIRLINRDITDIKIMEIQ